MTTAAISTQPVSEEVYRKRIWAWTMYDWANSAFATTIMAAVLPVYFSQVAGATLPSAAVATSIWSFWLFISLLIVAVLSPILGTISDVMRGKKPFLAFFAGLGIIATALLVLVNTGDWVLASVLLVVGRIGFSGANSFYDALLPHVSRVDDRDRVSARGYAMGYLGGGLLLAINVVMIFLLPQDNWGSRLSFLSVAIWWAVFSIPLFRHVPEPPAAAERLAAGANQVDKIFKTIGVSFQRLYKTFRDIRQYRELFKFLLAFLIYNDGIGTIIGVAAIYGAEMGFDSISLVLALLLVQFVGIPYSLIFGSLPNPNAKRRNFFLAFILFNLIALPLVGIAGRYLLSPAISGAPQAPYTSIAGAAGEGTYLPGDSRIQFSGNWDAVVVPASVLDADQDANYNLASEPGARVDFPFNGQSVELIYSTGPDHGIWAVELDGQPLLDSAGSPVQINAYHPTARYGESETFAAPAAGQHTLSLVNTGSADPASSGTIMAVGGVTVLPPARASNLLVVLGMILAVELVGLAIAFVLAPFFSGMARAMTTKRAVFLALVIYSVIAIWGFFLNSVVEFWFLAWMVAIVQGGSQALSRSLYSAMSPASKSGEFFGLFGIMEKFSALIVPILFGLAGLYLGSSRPAVLSLIVFFVVGGYILSKVDVEEGKRVASQEDAVLLAGEGAD